MSVNTLADGRGRLFCVGDKVTVHNDERVWRIGKLFPAAGAGRGPSAGLVLGDVREMCLLSRLTPHKRATVHLTAPVIDVALTAAVRRGPNVDRQTVRAAIVAALDALGVDVTE